ncbi:MAG: hypothetical protein ACK4TA_15125 [Saprospiraceae bacterium]
MSYQSRFRNYKTRREKNESTRRVTLRILLFLSIMLLLWMFINRVSLWDWVKTYFY